MSGECSRCGHDAFGECYYCKLADTVNDLTREATMMRWFMSNRFDIEGNRTVWDAFQEWKDKAGIT